MKNGFFKLFEGFAGYSVSGYANDLVKSPSITLDEAMGRSKREFGARVTEKVFFVTGGAYGRGNKCPQHGI